MHQGDSMFPLHSPLHVTCQNESLLIIALLALCDLACLSCSMHALRCFPLVQLSSTLFLAYIASSIVFIKRS